jgi:hypothetical protein
MSDEIEVDVIEEMKAEPASMGKGDGCEDGE